MGNLHHVWVLVMGHGCHLVCAHCFMVVVAFVATCICGWLLFVVVGGHCGQSSPLSWVVVLNFHVCCWWWYGEEKPYHDDYQTNIVCYLSQINNNK